MSTMEVQSPVQYQGKTPSLPPLLPPCRVCAEKASGFHYGANTCEACKGFFRRSLQRKEEYKCMSNGSCRIGVGRRNACAYCRWQKCLAVGMSKTAIKTGRYTHEKKTKDIEEVKRLEKQIKNQSEGTPSITSSMSSNGDVESPQSFPTSQPSSIDPCSPSTVVDSPVDSPATEEELDNIIQYITSIHQQQTPHTPEFFENLPEKEKEFLEQRELQRKMFGTMKPIPREEYMQIYQSTGIDIDGRREMVKHMIPCIEKSIKRFITFAKALPGFKDLPIEDQITLIKGSRFETFLLSAHKAFNASRRLYTHVCGYTLDVDGLSRVHTEDYIDAVFQVAARMQKLQLTVEEECVLRGIAILSRDRGDMTAPDQIEQSQAHMMAALRLLVHRRHRRLGTGPQGRRIKGWSCPGEQLTIARMLMLLYDMRNLTDMHRVQEEKINMEWSSQITFPPVIHEMCT